jgi:hypothetical protein
VLPRKHDLKSLEQLEARNWRTVTTLPDMAKATPSGARAR